MSTVVMSYDFCIRNYYSQNRDAYKETFRTNAKKGTLMKADSSALSKIAKALRDLDYSEDNGENIYNNVKAFVNTYNNLISSTSSSDNANISRNQSLLKKYTKENSEELEKIGITVSSSGKLELDKETLLKCKPAKVGKILAKDSEYMNNVKFYAGKIYKSSNKINVLA